MHDQKQALIAPEEPLDLFAEELPEQRDLAAVSTYYTYGTYACVGTIGGTIGSVGSFACATLGCAS